MNHLKSKLGMFMALTMVLGCGTRQTAKKKEDQAAREHITACMAQHVLDLVEDGATDKERASALASVFAWYNLSIQLPPSFSDAEEAARYTFGPGGSFEERRYMSEQSARVLMDENLIEQVDLHIQSPAHPKAQHPVGTVDIRKCIEEHLQGLQK